MSRPKDTAPPAPATPLLRDLRASGKFRNDMERRIRADGRRVQAVEGLRVQLDEAALPFEPADDFLD